MPSIGWIHPQVVHFVVALAFVGVGARIVSLLPLGPRFSFTGPMASWLIVFSAIASVLAARSGTDAHGPVERVPGAREAVQEHEEAGEWARDWLLGLAALEIVAFALSGKPKVAKGLQIASGVAGLVTLATVYEAAEHGGALVYNYAGGIGLRSKDTTDVRHLLVAGLYHNLQLDRTAGNKEAAARMVDELVRQMPNDTMVKYMGIESMIRDKNDAAGAMTMLHAMTVPESNMRMYTRHEMLMADAYSAAGLRDSARQTLEKLKTKVGSNPRAVQAIDDALAKLR